MNHVDHQLCSVTVLRAARSHRCVCTRCGQRRALVLRNGVRRWEVTDECHACRRSRLDREKGLALREGLG